jgi:hypothetical protein
MVGDYKPAGQKEKTENFFVAGQNRTLHNTGLERSKAGAKEYKWDLY